MPSDRENALAAMREWMRAKSGDKEVDMKLALHSKAIVDALLQPEIPPTPDSIQCMYWIACLETMGFVHRIENQEHIVEGHGFKKQHTGLRNIVVRIGHFLHYGTSE